MHHYFRRRGYTSYQLLGNSGTQPMYLIYSVLLCYILGTTSRPVGVAYRLYIYCARFLIVHTYNVDGYFLYEVVVDADYTDIYTYFWRKGLAGSRHWCTYTYLLFVSSLGAPSLYSDRVAGCPSNRWTLSVFLQKLKFYFKYKM